MKPVRPISRRPLVILLAFCSVLSLTACPGSSPTEPEPGGTLQAEMDAILPAGVELEAVSVYLDGSRVSYELLVQSSVPGGSQVLIAREEGVRPGRHELEVRIDRMTVSPSAIALLPSLVYLSPGEPLREIPLERWVGRIADGDSVRFTFDI